MSKLLPEERCPAGQWEESESFSYLRTATVYGNLEIVRDWLELEGRDKPDLVSNLVLSTAAMYGQLEVLQHAIFYGELSKVRPRGGGAS